MVQHSRSCKYFQFSIFLTGLLAWCFSSLATANLDQLFENNNKSSQTFLPVEEAFQLNAEIVDNSLLLHFLVTPGHYLYKKRFSFSSNQKETQIGEPVFPKGKEKYDVNFEETLEVFPENITVKIPVKSSLTEPEIEVRFQGCADAGLCYPPHTIDVTVANPNVDLAAAEDLDTSFSNQENNPSLNSYSPDSHQSIWLSLLLFLLAGIGLTFTPCVLPMIPILSSLLVGAASEGASRKRTFYLSLGYVLSMSVTFALAGTLMGLFGASLNLQAKLQSPWLLIPFAVLFILLALSMFGLYELQLPEKLRNRLNQQPKKPGSLWGAVVLGFLSALVVSPCVSAPLAGALIYISTTGDALVGGLSLLALGLGMGLPLMLIGLCGKKILPKAGSWMENVKVFFGFLMLGVAIWMLERVIAPQLTLFLWGALAIGGASWFGAVDFNKKSGSELLSQTLGLILLIYGALLIIGAAQGHKDPFKPLYSISNSASIPLMESPFQTVQTVADLSRQLEIASKNGKPAMIDVYADWCISCKIMEKEVFPQVFANIEINKWHLIKFDITENTPEQQKWLDSYQLFGPPALLFYGSKGQERAQLRSQGELTSPELLKKMKLTMAN
ncbi:protein-disulfide reductase DsbD [Endozoicomonas arenosclerae]|uniref:protein-disulfide reductase DsbD n=1 Tax=Endozoicomonas arenosclerae TaxID=1633495 RepID=UPI0007830539|nr:protein-disulfide reductase DsbD [Endozoicomonas arenosclerae]